MSSRNTPRPTLKLERERARFAQAWRDYRAAKRWLFGLAVLFLPLAIVLLLLPGKSESRVWIQILLLMGWGAATMYWYSRAASFACPACGKSYFRSDDGAKWLTRRCVHCGLPADSTRRDQVDG